MLARISQRMCVRGATLPPSPTRRGGAATGLRFRRPQYRPFAWRDAENDAKHWNVWFARSPLLQPEAWQAAGHGSTGRVVASASLYRRPSDKCFHRAPILPYFPCSPSVTRFGAYPAPGGTTRLCFGFAALRVSAFRKSCVQRTQKDFPNLPKKTPLGLGSGAHSRRFAQECPEDNPGKYNQGEMTWHSTKTRSL